MSRSFGELNACRLGVNLQCGSERGFHPCWTTFRRSSLVELTSAVVRSLVSTVSTNTRPLHRPREIRAADRTAAAASGGARPGGVIGMRVHFSGDPMAHHALILPRFLNKTPHLGLETCSFLSFGECAVVLRVPCCLKIKLGPTNCRTPATCFEFNVGVRVRHIGSAFKHISA